MANEITFDETPSVVKTNTIGEAWASLLGDPGQFIRHWNYKGAILSGVLRAPIFLITYLVSRESLKLALGAALVQFIFRFAFAGISGAMIQSFRRVEPPWKAMASILLVIPVISHILEYFLQWGFSYYTNTTDHTDQAIVRSICVSLFSALFALYIMRRNVMIVGEAESKSLWNDITQIPFLIYEFVAFVPNEISTLFRRGKYTAAVISIGAFGVFSQIVCWAVANRIRWTYGGGKEIPLLQYWFFDGIILMILAVLLSLFVTKPREQHF